MSKRTYLGAVCGVEGAYGIVFLDFPGCVSAGVTMKEVAQMGREALQGHVETLIEYGDVVPDPSVHRLEDVAKWLAVADDDGADPWVKLVPVEIDIAAHAPDVHVDVPRRLLSEIDQVSTNRRQFIMDATRRELERLKRSA